jgi:radical SAM superfamily enzyme YgiQ (UPF0313 family)
MSSVHTLDPPDVAKRDWRLYRSLPAGEFRFSFGFRILLNDTGNRDLIQAGVWKCDDNVKLATGTLPRKIDNPNSPYKTFHMDFKLKSPAKVEGRIFLTSSGHVEISELKIVPKVLPLRPSDPVALFMNPDRNLSSERIVHQGISAIAAHLEKVGIGIHALNTSQCDDEFIMERFRTGPYKVVGFFITSDDTVIGYVKNMSARIKQICPDILCLAGGPHATLSAEELLKTIPYIDVCVRGEGEQTCEAILDNHPLEMIPGITYRRNGDTVINPDRPLLPGADLPAAARHIYFNSDWSAHSISTSRGCPHNCQFCIGHEIFGRTIRFKPLEVIDRELRWIYEHEDHTKVVSINDDMFNMNRNRTLHLMEMLRQYPFHYFPRGVRADRLDDQTARAMSEAGVIGTSIGIESADNDALKAMCKGETLEDIERGIEYLRKYGIAIVAMFMIGNLGDTLDTVKKTIEFALKHQFEGLNMSCSIPFPGTALRQHVIKHNLMLETPYVAATGIINGNTTIYFETPQFPLADRIKAVELALAAGLLQKR